MKILITGVAGFIGMHASLAFLRDGNEVIGLDSINDYYDRKLKYSRLAELGIDAAEFSDSQLLGGLPGFRFIQMNLLDQNALNTLFREEKFECVINLAAQAGVRYSVTHPREYINANLVGFFNILENVRQYGVKRFMYASSSSVYGLNEEVPFALAQKTETPASLYAATKKSNELMAHSYSHLYGLPTMGIRFFTVYGPWGRPDMALFKFTKNILEGKPIEVYNNGEMLRDFTYVDDVVEGLVQLAKQDWKSIYNIQNLGRNEPVKLLDFVHCIEKETGREAIIDLKPLQQGDVKSTWADVSRLKEDFNYSPKVSLQEGVHQFVKWYRSYYKV
jgi:UDP-glucuronate 4-epimerase